MFQDSVPCYESLCHKDELTIYNDILSSWLIYPRNIIPLIAVTVANGRWMNLLLSANTASCDSKETFSVLPSGRLLTTADSVYHLSPSKKFKYTLKNVVSQNCEAYQWECFLSPRRMGKVCEFDNGEDGRENKLDSMYWLKIMYFPRSL